MTEINRRSGDPLLDDVLDEYAAAGPSREQLERWTREYPQFRRELIELTISWIELKYLHPVPPMSDPIDSQLRAASILGELLHALRSPPASSAAHDESKEASAATEPPPLDSLLGEAERHGLDVEQLANAARMSVSMIMSFHRRVVLPETVPNEALWALGNALKSPPYALYVYLTNPSQLSSRQEFKARQAPRITEKIGFRDLVKNDPELSSSDRALWLSIQRNESEDL